MKSKALQITQTGVFIALLLLTQILTAPISNPLITGTLVNLLLIMAVVGLGLSAGITIAALSPVLAKFLGIGPLWSLVPFIVLGNLSLLLVWHFIGARGTKRKLARYSIACGAAAVAKCLVLYLGVVKLAIPCLLKLSGPQADILSVMFSIPQLVTALLGGVLAMGLLPLAQRALKGGAKG